MGTRALDVVRVPLAAIAAEVAEDAEEALRQAGSRVAVGALPEIDADAVQMRQLLGILVSNALEYRRPGVPALVHIEGAIDEDGRRCTLSVTDNGIGFADCHAERIFAPFERLHIGGHSDGTGMGLAICRRIAERHGGTIQARGEPNAGATFTISLPVA